MIDSNRSYCLNDSYLPQEVIRSTEEEKQLKITNLKALQQRNSKEAQQYLQQLQKAALENKNLFNVLIETVKYCSLG
jgi:methylmalonyl-CoA mutase